MEKNHISAKMNWQILKALNHKILLNVCYKCTQITANVLIIYQVDVGTCR